MRRGVSEPRDNQPWKVKKGVLEHGNGVRPEQEGDVSIDQTPGESLKEREERANFLNKRPPLSTQKKKKEEKGGRKKGLPKREGEQRSALTLGKGRIAPYS